MTTVLITGAGSGGAENLINDLWSTYPHCVMIGQDLYQPLRIIGTNMDQWLTLKSRADKVYTIVPAGHPEYIDALNNIINKEHVDLVIPDNDTEVRYIASNRKALKCRTFLPSDSAIRICQDKGDLYKRLRTADVDVPDFTEIESCSPLLSWPKVTTRWVRMRRGSGSMGSLPVWSTGELRAWIKWWERHRDVSREDFLVCEYLPGSDYAVQSLWKDGVCILIKACERLRYVFGKNMPQGSSSSPSLARSVYNPAVIKTCISAVKAVDENASGMWSIDLKEDMHGVPHITEINIGRFCMISPIFDRVGRYNMAKVYIDLAMGNKVSIPHDLRLGQDVEEDAFLIRELDTLPIIWRRRSPE